MIEPLKAAYLSLDLIKKLDFRDYRLFKILRIVRTDYVLSAFIAQNNYLMATNEQLSRNLDRFLEKNKDGFADKHKN
jgi:hypothetical protein